MRFFTFFFSFFLFSSVTFAINDGDFYLGKVNRILGESQQEDVIEGGKERIQKVEIQVQETGEKHVIDHQTKIEKYSDNSVKAGQTVLLRNNEVDGSFYIADKIRIPSLILMFLLFSGIVVYFTGWSGVRAIGGLGISLAILAFYIAPSILHGGNPFVISFVGALVISFFSVFLSHGINNRTIIAFVSMIFVLIIALFLAPFFVYLGNVAGTGSEDAFFLQMGSAIEINMKGLLLGGIIIGTLGLLDDVTTTQVAAVAELKKAKPESTFSHLYKAGIVVGREHILSMMNTLALAYFGASMPLLLLFSLDVQPDWVTINSEGISEEIIRTIVGSISLVLAVPLSTLIASWYYSKNQH